MAQQTEGFGTILVSLDGSSLAEQTLPVAEALARATQSPLLLARVNPLVTWATALAAEGAAAAPEVYQQVVDDEDRLARDDLAQHAETVRAHNIAVRTSVTRGEPASSLIDLEAQERVGLVVTTTHGRTGPTRFALGSVADRVVHGGQAPVLLLRSFAPQRHRPELARTLVPLDGSPASESPLFSIAHQLAGPVIRAITLLRVVDPQDGRQGGEDAQTYLNSVRQRLIERLANRECSVMSLVRMDGNPAETIVRTGQEEQSDMVLMATHAEAGIVRLAFGCVTDRVLHDSQVPLLLVHPPRQ